MEYKTRLVQLISKKDFIWILSKKELKMKYSGSKLGIWWAIILPLFLAFSMNLIFTVAFKVSIPNYTLFVLSAILPWTFFSQSLSEVTNSFLSNRPVLKQNIMLKEAIPLSCVIGNFLNFIIGLAVMIPLFALFNNKIILYIPFLIIALATFCIFLCGLSLIFSVANVFYRDVSCFLSLGLMIWFWITPIFYSIDMIPYPYRLVGLCNPLAYFMLGFRDFLYYGRVDFRVIGAGILIAAVTFFGGYYIFLCKERELSKRL